MKLYRCEICGDPYLGEKKPANCPFCGAPARFIVKQKKYSNQVGKIDNLSEVSKKNLEAALDLEVNATKTYLCAMDRSKDDKIKNLFKAFSKHEAEHISLLSKALGILKPSADPLPQSCKENDSENMSLTADLEENAMKLYGKFLSEAVESRVQDIFTALIDVESEHLKIVNNLK